MLLNCDSEEDSWELLGLEGLGLDWIDQISQSWRKSVLNIHYKDWCCSSNTLTTWCKVPTHWKRPWCQQRLKAKKRAAEDEMVRWHYWLSGHESEQAPRDSRGQRSLACSSSWGHKELVTAKQLNTHTHTHTHTHTYIHFYICKKMPSVDNSGFLKHFKITLNTTLWIMRWESLKYLCHRLKDHKYWDLENYNKI